MGLREDILGLNDSPLQEVEVEEWGKTLFVRIASAQESENILDRMQKLTKGRHDGSWRAWFLQQVLCDAEGNRLFSGDDYKKLGEKNGVVIKRLFKLAAEINGLIDSDESGEVDDDPKNSSEETTDSGSDYL